MREFLKKVLSEIWPFSLFMRRIRELYEKNNTLQKEKKVLRQILEKKDQELLSLKDSGTYITWSSMEKTRQIAANYKEWRADHFIKEMINNPRIFDDIEQMFTDEESLKVFRWIIVYRFLTPIFGESELWKKEELSLLYHILPGPVSEEEFKESFSKAKAAADEHKFALFAEPYCIWHTFILKQYQYDDLFQYHPGDVVFDIGGYVGDTALFFSDLVGVGGGGGVVVTFEPHPGNIELIEQNIKHFGRKNIRLEKVAISDRIGEQTFTKDGSSGAAFSDDGITVKTTTLDQYVLENQIERISVIKMDIEGAEMAALNGGLNTIRKLRPILLVSVYHGGKGYYSDFTQLISFLKETLVNYQFHLRHKNAQFGETILVCIPNSTQN